LTKKIICLFVLILNIFFVGQISQANMNFNINDKVKVTVSALILRDKPSTLGKKIDVLNEDEVLLIIDGPEFNNGYEWYKIKKDNYNGWVAGEYLEKIGNLSDIEKIGIVNVESKLRLRSQPNVHSEILDKLENGTKVKILSDLIESGTYKWVKISINEKVGYVASKWISTSIDESVTSNQSQLGVVGVNKIGNINIDRDQNFMPIINIDSTKKIDYKSYLLKSDSESETKIVIDILRANIETTFNKNINLYPIKKIWASNLDGEKDVVRIVVTLNKNRKYMIEDQDGKYGIQLKFEEDNYYLGDGKVINNVDENDRKVSDSDSFMGKLLNVSRINNDKEKLIFKTSGLSEYKVIRLDNPKRFIIDFMDMELSEVNQRITVVNPYITRIRTSQFKPDSNYDSNNKIVRVVFDLKKDVLIQTDSKNNDLICTFGTKNSSSNLIFYSNDNGRSKLKSNVKDVDVRNIIYDLENHRIIIPLLKDINESTIPLNDQNIVNIEYSLKNNKTFAYIYLYNNVEYQANVDNENYSLILYRNKSKQKGKTIVIDPGHGGDNKKVYNGHIGDSGAISPYTNTREKDLTLKVGLKLKEELKNRGYNIIMTREEDVYVDLYKRAEIANNTDASAFISIHFNSLANASYKGIMTLYCPSYESELKSDNQYPLAKVLQESLVNGLNREDKSIRKRPELVVIRETKMPAVLLELGFLTNKEEEALVRTDSYQYKAAKTIADALDQYFINN